MDHPRFQHGHLPRPRLEPPTHEASRNVLVPARLDPGVEPHLRPSRIHPVPMRASRFRGAVGGAPLPRSAHRRGRSGFVPLCHQGLRRRGPGHALVSPSRHFHRARPRRSIHGTQRIVDRLNEAVIAEGGRIYLAKDSFTRAEHFRAMEPRLEKWSAVRKRWDPEARIRSAQSVRVFGDPS